MTLKVAGYDIYQQLFKDTKRFTNLTYSIGGHYHLSPLWHLTTNLGAAFRAPPRPRALQRRQPARLGESTSVGTATSRASAATSGSPP